MDDKLMLHNYLCQGYIIITVCLLATLCKKTLEQICMKFSGKAGNGTMNKLLHFGGNQDHGS